MFKCPFPECSHVFADILTKQHCETAHGMTKKAVIALYGQPEQIKVDHRGLLKNVGMHRVLTKNDFQM